MFGEYAQIASFIPQTRDAATVGGNISEGNLPAHLVPSSPTPLLPWGVQLAWGHRGQSAGLREDKPLVEDFIMVAEFSELEGPKPLLTIPKDAGENVDQNALSVKLMAVDHQTSSEGFSISEDTQVVLSDDEAGVSAFVHHFVLYDNQARGFVRPYCMVFVSTDIRKIMMFYEELSSQFKRAARFLKYGNRLLFVKDLERHLQDLDHTKGYLLNQVSRMRLKDTEGPGNGNGNNIRANTENELYKGLQNIRQSSTEIKEILSILKPLLHDRRLESRFRALEERAFQRGSEDVIKAEKLSLQEDWFSDNMYSDGTNSGGTSGSLKESGIFPVSLFSSVRSHTPLLVETKKAKRFNSPLRGLHELCSWGAKEGLRKLRCIHEYFRKDSMMLELERSESRLLEPSNSMITHGQCVTSNFLASISMSGASLCLSEDSSSLLQAAERLRRWPSIASNDTLESFKSVDSYLSIQDEENASLLSFCSSSPGVTTSTSGQDFMSAPTSPMTEEAAPFPLQELTKAPSRSLTNAMPQMDQLFMKADQDVKSVSNTNKKIHSVNNTNQAIPSSAVFVKEGVTDLAGNSLQGTPTGVAKDLDAAVKSVVHNQSGISNAPQDSDGSALKESIDGTRSVVNTKPGSTVNAHSTAVNAQPTAHEDSPDQTVNNHQDLHMSAVGSNVCASSQDAPTFLIDTRQEKQNNAADAIAGVETAQSSFVVENINSFVRAVTGTVNSISDCMHSGVNADSDRQIEDVFSGGGESGLVNSGNQQVTSDTEKKSKEIKLPDTVDENTEEGRDPSMPLLSMMPAQLIRDADRKHQPPSEPRNYVPANVPQKPESVPDYPDFTEGMTKNMEKLKLEFTESFKSLGDAASEISEAWVDLEIGFEIGSSVDGPCNTMSSTPSSETCTWRPRHGIYTVGDVLNTLAPGRPGFGICGVLSSYSNLQPVLFSLMIGRPVLVVGPARMESEVTKIVTAFSIFICDTKRKHHSIVDWMNRPLKITDLTKIQLAGVCRSEKRTIDATIPTAVKQYSTILNVESRTIVGPPYQGTCLHSLLQQKKSFHTDVQFVAFIHSWLMEIAAKAFIFYHSFCLGDAGGLSHSHSLERHREQYNSTVSSLMNRLSVKDSDILMVEHMAEKVKLSQLEPHVWAGVDKGSIVQPLTVPTRLCQTFRC